MVDPRYHPSLLIMAKNLGFGYLNSTSVLKIDNSASAEVNAVDEAYADGELPPQETELLQILDELIPTKKPRTKLTDTQKPFAYHEEGLKNLAAVWDHVNQEDIKQYKDWYRQAHADCVGLAETLKADIAKINPPDPIRMIIGIVAATSQGTLWEENLEVAKQVIQTRNVDKNLKITDNNLQKATKILQGDFSVLQTDKFGAFFASIENPELTQNTVVVDTHAAGMWIGRRLGVQDPMMQQNKPEGARLAAMVRDYRKLAAKVNYSAQSVQAITWSVWRKLPPNYETKYMKYGQKHPEVEMFKALYPYLYASGEGASRPVWRWRYNRFNDILRPEDMPKEEWDFVKDQYAELMPHHTPQEWYTAVKQFGSDLYKYYGFPKDAWDAFLAAYPNFGKALDEVQVDHTAAMFESVAKRLAR